MNNESYIVMEKTDVNILEMLLNVTVYKQNNKSKRIIINKY